MVFQIPATSESNQLNIGNKVNRHALLVIRYSARVNYVKTQKLLTMLESIFNPVSIVDALFAQRTSEYQRHDPG